MNTVKESPGKPGLLNQKGQTVIEYILVLVLISLVLVLAFNSGDVGEGITAATNEIAGAFEQTEVPIT